jgi:hypothetical protein
MHYYVTPYLKNIAENKAITELLIWEWAIEFKLCFLSNSELAHYL